jgi:ribosome recycling factor
MNGSPPEFMLAKASARNDKNVYNSLMTTDINTFKTRANEVEEWLSKELASIRTGRATITLLDDVMVEAYGTKTPINQNASINIEDPKTIRIVPWDKGLISEIESSINKADLGVSIMSDAEGVRVKFPDLTSETREQLIKQIHKKVEDAKISLRNERGDIVKGLETSQKAGEISEDDLKRQKDEVQKLVDEIGKKLEEKGKVKEEEIKV